ncbi:FxsA family protein [Gordonia sp. VNK21]|uniref:FxsA family protein n=1 Tax=Gordonia sp. VNK21 TaxID=3382483 RepID=UPI0038D46FF0
MTRWIVAGYLIVEIAAFWAMVHFLGWGWAILITVAAAAVGFAVLGRRTREIFTRARTGTGDSPGAALTDSALLTVAGVLTVLPGVVTTVLGLILTASPVRRRLQPVVVAGAARQAGRLAERVSVVRMAPNGYVDGSVVDGTVVDDGRVTGDVVDVTVRNPDGSVHVDIPELTDHPYGDPDRRTGGR